MKPFQSLNSLKGLVPKPHEEDKIDLPNSWSEEVETGAGGIMNQSARPIMVAFAVFLGWAILVPLDSAVISSGTLISEGRNQVVQHRTGGLIRKIHKHEGDSVRAGEVIISLDTLVDQASLTGLQSQQAMLNALRTRLESEKVSKEQSSSDIFASMTLRGVATYDPIMTASIDSALEFDPLSQGLKLQLDAEQLREFEQGRLALAASIASVKKQAQGLEFQRAGLENQIKSLSRQRSILQQQFSRAQKLNQQGFISSQQVWQLESQLLQMDSQIDGARTQIQTLSTSIDETHDRIVQIKTNDARQTSQQLTEVLSQLRQVEDSLKAALSARAQTEIRAPTDGTIVRMAANTVGAVVPSGQTIAEVVPDGGQYLVEGRIALTDITHVFAGQDAEVQISALNGRLYDPIKAKLIHVDADSTEDERSGTRFYKVIAQLDDAMPKDVSSQLSVGMSGDIFMKGERRTFAAYLMKPFTESLGRSFREPK